MSANVEPMLMRPCLRVEVHGCAACNEPLGIADGSVSDAQMTHLTTRGPGYEAHHARLNASSSWCANMSYASAHYLRIDLTRERDVTAIETQGYQTLGHYVESYFLEYQNEASKVPPWTRYGEQGSQKTFQANSDANGTVRNYLKTVIRTRYISIVPKKWYLGICMRVEIYGCEACGRELGLSNGRVLNTQLTASSHMGDLHRPQYARLKNPTRVWCAALEDTKPFLQVDLQTTHRVRYISTQGSSVNGSDVGVTSYHVQFGMDRLEWHNYTQNGTLKIFQSGNVTLPVPIVAVFIQIRPMEWNGSTACLRLELYGCKACADPLGLENGFIADHFIFGTGGGNARLNVAGWGGNRLFEQRMFLRVDLDTGWAVVNGIATRGSGDLAVTEYTLAYSLDLVHWWDHTEDGLKKILKGNEDSYTTVRHNFRFNVTTRYVELTVVRFSGESFRLQLELYGCRVCERALGLESKDIPDNAFFDGGNFIDEQHMAKSARLNGPYAWCGRNGGALTIDLQTTYFVTAIAIQGLGLAGAFATTLDLYRAQATHLDFQTVMRTSGPTDADNPVIRRPRLPFLAREVKVSIHRDRLRPCLRLEIYGRKVSPCEDPADRGVNYAIGMESGLIPSSRITASTTLDADHQSFHGRLGTILGKGAWCSDDQNGQQFLQVELEAPYRIMAFAIQGKHPLSDDAIGLAWVTTYSVSIKQRGGRTWKFINNETNTTMVFAGNTEHNLTVKNVLSKPFTAKSIRVHPVTWYNKICLRLELYGCKECFSPLGMENLTINSPLAHSGDTSHARLMQTGYWSSDTSNLPAFFRITLGEAIRTVTGLAIDTERHGFQNHFVLSYSIMDFYWQDYYEGRETKIFSTYSEVYSISKIELGFPFLARYVRINFKDILLLPMQFELYGCTECYQPLGLVDANKYPNTSFTASSSDTGGGYFPHMARLIDGQKPWCMSSSSSNYWLAIDLGVSVDVSAVEVKGNDVDEDINQWIWDFSVEYSNDYVQWKQHFRDDFKTRWSGNKDKHLSVMVQFNPSLFSKAIRFRPQNWKDRACLKVEVYTGCTGCKSEIPLYNTGPEGKEITTSSYFGPGYEPYLVRMRTTNDTYGWCAGSNVGHQYVQFNFKEVNSITGITTDGQVDHPDGGNASWVTKYRVEHSMDGITWFNYTEQGKVKQFQLNNSIITARVAGIISRMVRLVAIQWKGWICMKVKVHGCPVCSSRLEPSATHNGNIHPSWIQLFIEQAFQQIDVGEQRQILSAVAVVPSSEGSYFYTLAYTTDGLTWLDYTENGVKMIFRGNHDRGETTPSSINPVEVRSVRFYPIRYRFVARIDAKLYGCQACDEPFGMQSGLISNASINASSYLAGYEPWRGRLGGTGLWCSGSFVNNYLNYLQVDLGYLSKITAIDVGGDPVTGERVRQVRLSLSSDGIWWDFYRKDGGDEALLEAYGHTTDTRRVGLRSETHARYIRMNPTSPTTCMKVEIRGCKVDNCQRKIGIEMSGIYNDSLKASSSLGPDFRPWFARLNGRMGGGAWCSRVNDKKEFLQVNLPYLHNISAVIIQGRAGKEEAWVTKLSVEYSLDGNRWERHSENNSDVFNGNTASDSVAEIILTSPIYAKYIRLRPVQWHTHVCMRVELRGCPVGGKAYGMESRDLRHRLISSSSRISVLSYEGHLFITRWKPHFYFGDQFYQIAIMPYGTKLSELALRGDSDWVSLFTLQLSMDDKEWFDYRQDGDLKVFKGPADGYIVKRYFFPQNLTVGHIRITPKQWYLNPFLQVELYVFDGCDEPIGVSNLPNSSFNASSHVPGYEPWRARLGSSGAWCPSTTSREEYIEINLGDVYVITAIATEGHPTDQKWMYSYMLTFREDERDEWSSITTKIQGADPRIPRIKTKMDAKIQAQYLRLHNYEYIDKPCLRVEVFGCLAISFPLGMSIYKIPDSAITASSYADPYTRPEMARLHSARGHGAWCADANDSSPYIQVDLKTPHRLGFVSTQAQLEKNSWVQKFSISYRLEDQDWEPYGQAFSGNIDTNTVVKNALNKSIEARFIRIHPVSWNRRACTRLEIYGFEVNTSRDVHGLEVDDSDITAGWWHVDTRPHFAKMAYASYWRSHFPQRSNFLLVDLRSEHAVVSMLTRCAGNAVFREFSLHFSTDGVHWMYYVQDGRKKLFAATRPNPHEILLKHVLQTPVITRFVKFVVETLTDSSNIAFKMQLYGKKNGCVKNISVMKQNPPVTIAYKITTSSGMVTHDASQSGNITWCSEFKDKQYIQFEFLVDVRIVGLATGYNGTRNLMVHLHYAGQDKKFVAFSEDGETDPKDFNTGSSTLSKGIVARTVRIVPFFQDSLCFQADVSICATDSPPLGMHDRRIKDSQITASTHLSSPTIPLPGEPASSTLPSKGRLDADMPGHAWCAGIQDTRQFLQIDLDILSDIVAIATQGVHMTALEAWVSEFVMSYSASSALWEWYATDGKNKTLQGNQNAHRVVKQMLFPTIRALRVRVHPCAWRKAICLSVELFGNPVCRSPLGVNSGLINDSAMTVMDEEAIYLDSYPFYARLHRIMGMGAWCAPDNDTERILQIDLGQQKVVTGIATQGRHLGYQDYVTSFNLEYSTDGNTWVNYTDNNSTVKIFQGNQEQHEVVSHKLKKSITARFVRFHPLTWNNMPCLRVELLGCERTRDSKKYSDFSSWSECQVSCGGGIQIRTRNCSTNYIDDCRLLGPRSETRSCHTNSCPAPNITYPRFIASGQVFSVKQANCSQGHTYMYTIGTSQVRSQRCSANHVFEEPGLYSLHVANANALATRGMVIVQDAIVGLEFASYAGAVVVKQPMKFHLKLAKGTMVKINVDFGDKSSYNIVVGEGVRPYVKVIEHIYSSLGVFNINLQASNRVSNKSIATTMITEIPISANITFETLGRYDVVYQLDQIKIGVIVYSGSNPRVLFDIGNNLTFTNLKTLVYNYTVPGVYNVGIQAFNNASRVKKSFVVTVNKIIPFTIIDLTIRPNAHTRPTIMQFDDHGANPYECDWYFGDGNSLAVSSTQNISTLSHTYTNVGVYNVTVKCINNFGTNISAAIAIVEIPIVANITFHNLGKFRKIYQLDKLRLQAIISSRSNYMIAFDLGNNVTYRDVKKLDFNYTDPGVYTINTEVYNNVSRVNRTFLVTVYKIIPFTTANLTNQPNALAQPTVIFFDYNGALPYECDWKFGDGNSLFVSSDHNISVILYNYARIGRYGVIVVCNNNLGQAKFGTIANVQKKISEAAFTDDSPTLITNATTFTIRASHYEFSCFVADIGNGTVGFGKPFCLERFPNVAFQDVLGPHTFDHVYLAPGVYLTKLTAWNYLSEIVVAGYVVVQKVYCMYPNARILTFDQSQNSSITISRRVKKTFETASSIDCKATQTVDYTWTLYLRESGMSSEAVQFLGIRDELVIHPMTLHYGSYLLRFNVSMRGQHGVYRLDEGYLSVIPSQLVAVIDGGQFIQRGLGTLVTFNATLSYDPDYPRTRDLDFYWFCYEKNRNVTTDIDALFASSPLQQSPEFNATRFCNESYPDRLVKAGSTIRLETSSLTIYQTYVVILVLSRNVNGTRRRTMTSQEMEIVRGNPPALGIRCVSNCNDKVSPNLKLSIESVCDEKNIGKVSYYWNLTEVSSGYQQPRPINLDNITLTGSKQRFIAIRPNSLKGGSTYHLHAYGSVPNRAIGYARAEFTVNVPPSNGICEVDKRVGFVNSTKFTFACKAWLDEDIPLTYEFSYRASLGLKTTIYVGDKTSVQTKLPVGDPYKNYSIPYFVRIIDAFGAFAQVSGEVQVFLPPEERDALLVKTYKVFEENTFTRRIKAGNIDEVTKEIDSQISIINVMALESGNNGSEHDRARRQKIRTIAVGVLANEIITSLAEVRQIGPSLAYTTAVKKEVSLESQIKAFDSLVQMESVLQSALEIEQFSSPSDDLRDLGEIGLVVAANIRAASGDSARVYSSPPMKDSHQDLDATRLEAKELSGNVSAVIDRLSKVLLSLMVPGEQSMSIKTPSMDFTLKRSYPEMIGNTPIGNTFAGFQLPNASSMFDQETLTALGHVDTEMTNYKENPYTWDSSGETIKSNVISLSLTDMGNVAINVSELTTPINLFIPRSAPSSENREKSLFVSKKNGSIIYHSVNIDAPSLSIRIYAGPQATFQVFLKKDRRPSLDKRNLIKNLPDYSSCSSIPPETSDFSDCKEDPYMIFLDEKLINETGLYYIALRFVFAHAPSSPRVRRDCGGGGRERRSCLSNKEAPYRPPQPLGEGAQLVPVVPVFDETKDAKYSIQVFQSPCKYWDKEREMWSTMGCKAGPQTRLEVVHCVCTHLTAFGGGLLVAPNPIDFDKVWAGFKNISDNLSVVVTIAVALAIYIVCAVWARRMDNKDINKDGVTTITSTNTLHGDHIYELTLYTGSWKGSCTTANVFVNIIGDKGQTGPLSLTDSSKQLFTEGAANTFVIPLDFSLGQLRYLRVWHDMTGYDSSWFLNFAIIKDLQMDSKWIFMCSRWLALEKDDGLVDRVLLVSTVAELKNFKTLFNTKVSNDLFDGHLWMSVVKKPPRSPFTRVQRLTCCMSLLFTTMMTSAMFFNIGGDPDTSTVSLGPLTFSVRQLIIGIQSSFIALPVNILVVQIFRNLPLLKAPEDGTHKKKASEKRRKTEDSTHEKAVPKKNNKICPEQLPYWFLYVAWALCVTMILTSAAITLFYSMMWGKEISNQWLASTLVSFFQDAFLTQPIKVVALAVFVAAILKTLPNDFSGCTVPSSDISQHQETDMMLGEQADPEVLERARKFKLKEEEMFSIMSSVLLHLVFLGLLLVVGYTARDPAAYGQTRILKDALQPLPVYDAGSLWEYVETTILPFTFNNVEYNGLRTKEEGVVADVNLFLIGMPRIRQLRVIKEICKTYLFAEWCADLYSSTKEQKSFYLPGWGTKTNLTYAECPFPWRYRDTGQLNTLPYWGQLGWYGGGGYTADLGYNTGQADSIIVDLKKNRWLDHLTRATFIEFTVFNAQVNLFSSVTFLFESQGTGGGIYLLKVETFRLYPHVGPGQTLVILCEITVVVVTLILAYKNIKKIYRMKMEYFKQTWNIVQLVVICLTLSAVVLFILRMLDTQKTIKKLRENPFVFVSFQYATQWAELNTYIVGIVIFLSTLRLLYLISFNRHISMLYNSISRSFSLLAQFAVEVIIVFTSFAIFTYVVFGSHMDGFGTFQGTLGSLFAMLLGKGYYSDLSQVDVILGPLLFAVFTTTMMLFMLNIFVAIVMEPYEEAKQAMADEQTDEFDMATFMIDRLKVFIGISRSAGDPWQARGAQYISHTKQLKNLLNLFDKRLDSFDERVTRLHQLSCEEQREMQDALSMLVGSEVLKTEQQDGTVLKQQQNDVFVALLMIDC